MTPAEQQELNQFLNITNNRMERIENLGLALSLAVIGWNQEHAWQQWADPLHQFIKVVTEEREALEKMRNDQKTTNYRPSQT